jgi:hypothetical protein
VTPPSWGCDTGTVCLGSCTGSNQTPSDWRGCSKANTRRATPFTGEGTAVQGLHTNPGAPPWGLVRRGVEGQGFTQFQTGFKQGGRPA